MTIVGVVALLISIFILPMGSGVDSVEMIILMFMLPLSGTAMALLYMEIENLGERAKTVDALIA